MLAQRLRNALLATNVPLVLIFRLKHGRQTGADLRTMPQTPGGTYALDKTTFSLGLYPTALYTVGLT